MALAVPLARNEDLSAARTQLQSARTLNPAMRSISENLGCLAGDSDASWILRSQRASRRFEIA